MARGIVIAVDPAMGTFAVETEDGQCAVLTLGAGPPLQAGDVVEGDLTAKGWRGLLHEKGEMSVEGTTGPIPLEEALTRVSQFGAL
jgi:hypothetical protein